MNSPSESSERHDTVVMFRDKIDSLQRKIQSCESEIDQLAKKQITEFHFLDHKVSKFWDCDKSPIGKCVWDISEKGFYIDCACIYCGNPVERK